MTTPPRHPNDALPPGVSLADCPSRVRADLKAYADGELSPLRRAWVRVHLHQCPACREELADMKKITELFTAAANGEEPFAPQLRSRVLSRLDGLAPAGSGLAPAAAPVPSPTRPAPLWRKQPALVFGGGGTVLAASLAIFVTMNHSTVPAVQTPTAAAPTSSTQGYDGMPALESQAPSATAAVVPAAPAARDTEAKRPVSVPAAPLRRLQVADGTAAPPAATAAAPVASSSFTVPDTAGSVRIGTPVARQGTAAGRAYAAPGGGGAVDKSGVWATTTDADDGRQVHKEASLGLRVEPGGLQAASDKVEELVKSSGGFVASNNLSTDDATGEKSADLTLRVPVKDFESVMASLAKMGNVVSKQLTGEDITEKTTDATTAEQVLVNEAQETARKLANQSMSEKRTGQKEAELRQIRMQLAQTRARLGLLRKMAALSTINVSLTEKPVKKAAGATNTGSGFFNGMQETNKAAMQAFQTAVRVPLVLAVWVLAFSPIWVPLILAYRWASLKTLASRVVVSPTPSAAGDDGGA